MAQMPHKHRESTLLELVRVLCTQGDTVKYVSHICHLIYKCRTYPLHFAPKLPTLDNLPCSSHKLTYVALTLNLVTF